MSTNIHTLCDAQEASPIKPRPCVGRKLSAIFRQLRERKVSRAATGYALMAWLLLQIGEVIFPPLGLPEWTLTLLVVFTVLGFPVAMLLAWLLQWTDDGLVLDVPSASISPDDSSQGIIINVLLLLAASAISVLLVSGQLAGRDIATVAGPAVAAPQMTVRPFVVQGRNEKASALGLEDQVRHELLRQGTGLTVVAYSPDAARNAPALTNAPRWALDGSVSVEGDQAYLIVQLLDLASDRYVWSMSLSASMLGVVQAREQLGRRVVTAMLQQDDVVASLAPQHGTAMVAADSMALPVVADEWPGIVADASL